MAQLVLYTTMPPNMATYGHFLLKAHKETEVPHTPGLQYNDVCHGIRNRVMHNNSRNCKCLQSNTFWSFTYKIKITRQWFNWYHSVPLGFSEI